MSTDLSVTVDGEKWFTDVENKGIEALLDNTNPPFLRGKVYGKSYVFSHSFLNAIKL
jgi:hypothetical protein